MYPELEINESNPDFNCPFCNVGIDITTEFDGDSDYVIICPKCSKEINVSQKVYHEYVCKSTKKEKIQHCECDACINGTMHNSDCAVHNEPYKSNEECNCM